MTLAFCIDRANHINKPLVKIVRENKTELKLNEGKVTTHGT